jgi:hypothetical protein
MIKHFLKKNGKKLIALSLILVMWWAGFYCAWKIQGHKIVRYKTIIVTIGILLVRWEGKIEELEKEKEEREKEEKKQRRYNELTMIE